MTLTIEVLKANGIRGPLSSVISGAPAFQVNAPVRPSVELSVAAPVTPSVPPTVALPVATIFEQVMVTVPSDCSIIEHTPVWPAVFICKSVSTALAFASESTANGAVAPECRFGADGLAMRIAGTEVKPPEKEEHAAETVH